jgi:hypothetical protein
MVEHFTNGIEAMKKIDREERAKQRSEAYAEAAKRKSF